MSSHSPTEKGQGLIEALIAVPAMIIGVSIFFVLIYGTISSMLTHHCLYEMLICQQTAPTPPDCQSQAQKRIVQGLVVGELLHLVFQESPSFSHAQAEIQLPLHFRVLINESLQLPLQPGSR